jgi:hypothetical protein
MTDRPDRFSIDLPAAVLSRPDGAEALARVQNLSMHGLMLTRLARPVQPEEAVWIEIPQSPGRGRVGLLGRVCWTEDDRAGVAIEAMLPHHRERFVGLVEQLAG